MNALATTSKRFYIGREVLLKSRAWAKMLDMGLFGPVTCFVRGYSGNALHNIIVESESGEIFEFSEKDLETFDSDDR